MLLLSRTFTWYKFWLYALKTRIKFYTASWRDREGIHTQHRRQHWRRNARKRGRWARKRGCNRRNARKRGCNRRNARKRGRWARKRGCIWISCKALISFALCSTTHNNRIGFRYSVIKSKYWSILCEKLHILSEPDVFACAAVAGAALVCAAVAGTALACLSSATKALWYPQWHNISETNNELDFSESN